MPGRTQRESKGSVITQIVAKEPDARKYKLNKIGRDLGIEKLKEILDYSGNLNDLINQIYDNLQQTSSSEEDTNQIENLKKTVNELIEAVIILNKRLNDTRKDVINLDQDFEKYLVSTNSGEGR